jgi:transcriptional regulator with XRE-family HTH domain
LIASRAASPAGMMLMESVRHELGQKLRDARIRADLTQAQVPDRAGPTQQCVSLVEAARRNITPRTITAIARVAGHEVSSCCGEDAGREHERSIEGARVFDSAGCAGGA